MWLYSLPKAYTYLPLTGHIWKAFCDICREIIYSIAALIKFSLVQMCYMERGWIQDIVLITFFQGNESW